MIRAFRAHCQLLTSAACPATGCHSDQLKDVGEDRVIKHVVNRPHRRPGYALTENSCRFRALRDGSTVRKYVKNSSKTC
jgi:hypothetical protein